MCLDILCSCSLEQPTETPTDFTRHFCGYVHFNNQQRSQHYFIWHFVFIFTWTAHRKTNIIYLTLCGGVHLNSQQRNWHILLDILWSCYLNHLQINQHISPDILCLYSLALPPTKKKFILLNVFFITWTSFREVNIFYLTFCLLCSLKQPTEKPTIEKSSAAKDPTDPPSKGEEYQDETVSEKEDPITKGVYTWQDFILLFLLTHKHYC